MRINCPFKIRFKIQDCKIQGKKHPYMLGYRDEPTRDKKKICGINLSRDVKSWDETFWGCTIS
jgi:hypothetical protein